MAPLWAVGMALSSSSSSSSSTSTVPRIPVAEWLARPHPQPIESPVILSGCLDGDECEEWTGAFVEAFADTPIDVQLRRTAESDPTGDSSVSLHTAPLGAFLDSVLDSNHASAQLLFDEDLLGLGPPELAEYAREPQRMVLGRDDDWFSR